MLFISTNFRLTIKYVRSYYLGMKKTPTRERILKAGLRVLLRQGYSGAGIREVMVEAGVPLGSFSNHFRAKESFVAEVLDLYFENLKRLVDESLNDKTLSPRARLKQFLDVITGRLSADGFQRGCLIGDLSLEASLQSKLLRERLEEIFLEWRTPFAQCIAEAQTIGEIGSLFEPVDLAEFLLASWEGAILRMKVEGGAAPLDRFKNIVFETIFKKTEKQRD